MRKNKRQPTKTGKVCMCKDGSYSQDCCGGEVYAQEIGSLENGSESNITYENETRNIVRN